MSGPYGELAPLFVRTAVEVSLWPLALWCDQGQAAIECAACDYGVILTAGGAPVPLMLAELTARVEAHVRGCPVVQVPPTYARRPTAPR